MIKDSKDVAPEMQLKALSLKDKADTTLHLLRLPAEIRARIYHYASFERNGKLFYPLIRLSSGLQRRMTGKQTKESVKFRSSTRPIAPSLHHFALHNLLRVNRQLCDEVLDFMRKHTPLAVRLNTPAMNDEFGYKWTVPKYLNRRGDLLPIGLCERVNTDTKDSVGGPYQQEIKKWRKLYIYTIFKDYDSNVINKQWAGPLECFLRSFQNWSMPPNTSIMFDMDPVYSVKPDKHPFAWSSPRTWTLHAWLKDVEQQQSWQIKLFVSEELRYEIRPRPWNDHTYDQIREFMRVHETLIVNEETW